MQLEIHYTQRRGIEIVDDVKAYWKTKTHIHVRKMVAEELVEVQYSLRHILLVFEVTEEGKRLFI